MSGIHHSGRGSGLTEESRLSSQPEIQKSMTFVRINRQKNQEGDQDDKKASDSSGLESDQDEFAKVSQFSNASFENNTDQAFLTAGIDLELMRRIQSHIGDIRVRYHYKTSQKATILAQQWNRDDGVTSFRTFNFLKVDAKVDESTEPMSGQLLRNQGLFQTCQNYNGGVADSYVMRAEPGDEY